MTTVVEEALRLALTQPEGTRYVLDLPVTIGRRPPLVDIDSNADVSEYLDRSEHDLLSP